jgi:hypothetical protein
VEHPNFYQVRPAKVNADALFFVEFHDFLWSSVTAVTIRKIHEKIDLILSEKGLRIRLSPRPAPGSSGRPASGSSSTPGVGGPPLIFRLFFFLQPFISICCTFTMVLLRAHPALLPSRRLQE